MRTNMRDMEDGSGGRRQYEPAAADLPIPREDGASVASDDEDSDGEFEFPSVSCESAASGGGAAVAADELFAGGRIRAFYPVFGRVLDDAAAVEPPPSSRAPLGRLFQLEQARTSSVASTSSSASSASSSSADAGLDGAPPESYCLWTPGSSSAASSPSRPPRKSGSTGSVARWRRIGELVGGRSRSDGKEKFLFFSAPPSPARDRDLHSPAGTAKSKPKPPTKGSKASAAGELDVVAAGRRMSYGGGKASPGGRRTFLPYRQDLVGLFANVHGLSRSPHHF
ncbi:unnamed protein product [Urochloa humidicola]